ncbi:MAG: hypothetical protein U9R20_07765 [Thermodesulfobacteriota bacterium]|nr:hypothetical protein [Thermodesulfobacteriota bacterium]
MPKAVKISDELAAKATIYAKVKNRSLAGQVEYWAKLGKIADENPDLPISFIKDIMIGRAQIQGGQKTPYVFGENE